ncbi:hypothetical protein H5410_005615 [Solanum commersonii]|uniref:Uncharacterized protein n=1 Tax=Solanum commersonii TaxID=4109 RepID=A0A9J6A732_SOLCO|nr:hypothetical protein H5410_005615 [Solanum commersonii]
MARTRYTTGGREPPIPPGRSLARVEVEADLKVEREYMLPHQDHSAQLVGIVDPLGDLPFGLVHRLSALAFNKFKLCNIRRWTTASRNRSVTRRLLIYLVDSIFSLRAWHTGTLGETIAIRQLA